MKVEIHTETISEANDIALLEKYGFMFEKNIKQYLHNIAKELRNENNKN